MNGQLANVIALAAHGSAWLADRSGDFPDVERTNSTFQFVARTRFESPSSRWRRPLSWASSRDWLSWLAAKGTSRLWLVTPEAAPRQLESHLAAGFSNGGGWALLATGPHPTVWSPSWEVIDPPAGDNRIWGVRFIGSRVDVSAAPSRPPVAPALTNLVSALVDIREFARDHGLGFWADRFDDGIDLARADDPEIPYHPDLTPRSKLPAEAIRLLAAGSQSWVFGGMGSWNDLWLEDPSATERLQRVTRNLYTHMLTAFVAATNADLLTHPPEGQRSR